MEDIYCSYCRFTNYEKQNEFVSIYKCGQVFCEEAKKNMKEANYGGC